MVAVLATVVARSASAQPVNIPDSGLAGAIREALNLGAGEITAQDMERLTTLNAAHRGIASLDGLGAAHNLADLNLGYNALTEPVIPAGLTSLKTLTLDGNGLTQLSFAENPRELWSLSLNENWLEDFSFLAGLSNLIVLKLQYNDLTHLDLPPAVRGLNTLDLGFNLLTNLSFLAGLTNLETLNLDDNGLRTVPLPPGVTNLTTLTLSINRLTNFAFLAQLPWLSILDLSANFLTNIALPDNLGFLAWINLAENRLTDIFLPQGCTNLTTVNAIDNALRTVVLPEPLADGSLAAWVSQLRAQGVTVHPYAIDVTLRDWRRDSGGSFSFQLSGPPGIYQVLASTNFNSSFVAGRLTNQTGYATFTNVAANGFLQLYHWAVRLAPSSTALAGGWRETVVERR